MPVFNDILTEDESELLLRFTPYLQNGKGSSSSITVIASEFKLRKEQLTCALGFNSNIRMLIEILPILGFATFNELDQERNRIFINDIYKRLSLDNVIRIYERIQGEEQILEVMQYLLKNRLESIEGEIETTVNSMIIERYKNEMRAIYNLGIASIDFTEERLDKKDSGFRALLNEVTIIVESKMMPIGEIFFRDTILPQEKQKLLNKGLIPKELVQSRINEKGISIEEKKILTDYLAQQRT